MTGDHVGQRALAGAVRPHQRVNLALIDGQIDALEDFFILNRDVQVLNLKHRGAHRTDCPSCRVAVRPG